MMRKLIAGLFLATALLAACPSIAQTFDAAGNLKVNVAAGGAAGGTSSSYGSAFPGTGTAIGGTDGTNMQPVTMNNYSGSSYAFTVDCVVGCSGGGATFGSAFPSTGSAIGVTDGTNMRPITGINYSGSSYSAAVTVEGALPAGTNLIGKFGIDQTTPGTTNGVQVNAALPAGTNLMGKVGIDQTTPGTTNGVQVNAALPAGTNKIGTFDPATIATWGLMSGTTPGTAPTNTQIVGCIYNSSAPSPTTGQTLPVQCNSAGAVTVTGGYATGASTTGMLFSPISGINGTTMKPLLTDSSGNLLTNPATAASWSIGATGSAVTANATQVGNNVGGNLTTPIACQSHVFKHITSATDTQLVAASGSTNIYVCDYDYFAGGTNTVYLEKATSGTCATLTQLTGAYSLTAQTGRVGSSPYYRGIDTGASAQLCANTSGTGAVDVDVYYSQF